MPNLETLIGFFTKPFLSVGGDQAEKKVKHCFSEPWEDSDVILVVEDEKFHVHRLILSMNSPVFKAMFKSQFRESTANEIPLPEKNASGVLDFLKIIYGFQYIQERVEITSKYFLAKANVYICPAVSTVNPRIGAQGAYFKFARRRWSLIRAEAPNREGAYLICPKQAWSDVSVIDFILIYVCVSPSEVSEGSCLSWGTT